jgi:hypothetical protein
MSFAFMIYNAYRDEVILILEVKKRIPSNHAARHESNTSLRRHTCDHLAFRDFRRLSSLGIHGFFDSTGVSMLACWVGWRGPWSSNFFN